jgi:hypothetical protein
VEIAKRELCSDLREAGDGVTLRIEQGDPPEVILRIAKEQGSELIVTGVARNETLGRFTLGKTVDRLLRVSEVPLLIVTDRAREPYQMVVVAVDFSDASGARSRRPPRSSRTSSSPCSMRTTRLAPMRWTMRCSIERNVASVRTTTMLRS